MQIVEDCVERVVPRAMKAWVPAALVIAASALSLCATLAVERLAPESGGAEPHRLGHLARGL
ncbi:MAG: hypothetical protein ACK4MF_03305 [Hyphomicrobiaceae bacterium]